MLIAKLFHAYLPSLPSLLLSLLLLLRVRACLLVPSCSCGCLRCCRWQNAPAPAFLEHRSYLLFLMHLLQVPLPRFPRYRAAFFLGNPAAASWPGLREACRLRGPCPK